MNTRIPNRRRALVAVGALAAALLLGVLFTLQSDAGTITVEWPDGTLPDDVKVVLVAGGRQIEITSRDRWIMTVAPGDYGVQVRGGDDQFTYEDGKIAVSRGGKSMLTVTRKPAVIAKPTPEVKPEPKGKPGPLDEGDWKRGASSGNLPGILTAPTPIPGIRWQLMTGTSNTPPAALAWSPDGKLLASAEKTLVRLFRFEKGTLRLANAFPAYGYTLSWSPDGRRLATIAPGDEKSLRVWDAGTETTTDYPVSQPMHEVTWSPDGGTVLLFYHNNNTVNFFDVTTRAVKPEEMKPNTRGVSAAAWHPDSKRTALLLRDGQVVLWDVAGGKEIRRFPSGLTAAERTASAALDPAGKWLAVAHGDEGRLLDAEGKLLAKFQGSGSAGGDGVKGCQWTADGKHLAAAYRIYDVRDPSNPLEIGRWQGGTHCFAISPDGQHLAADGGASKQGWYVSVDSVAGILAGTSRTSTPVFKSPDYSFNISTALAWSRDGNLCCVGDEETLTIWDVRRQSAQRVKVLDRARWGLSCRHAGFSADGRRLAAWFDSRKNNISLLASRGGPFAKSHDLKHEEEVLGMVWSPRGELLATRTEKSAHVWDAATGARTHRLAGHTDAIRDMAWTPDGKRLVTASLDKTVRVWDVETGAAVGEPIEFDHVIQRMALSRGGDRVAVFDASGAVEVRRLKDGERVWRVTDVAPYWQQQLAWTPDDRSLLTLFSPKMGGGEFYGLFDATDGKAIWTRKALMGHGATHFRLAPSGKYLLQNAWNPSLFDFGTGEKVATTGASLGEWATGESAVATIGHSTHVVTFRAPRTADPRWVGLNLPGGEYASFSAAGKPLTLSPKAADHLAYLVRHADTGRYEVLTHAAFTDRFAGKATKAP